MDQALVGLAALRARCEEVARIIEKRESSVRGPRMVRCQIAIQCDSRKEKPPAHCRIEMQEGKEVFGPLRRDAATGLYKKLYICSQQCYLVYSRSTIGGVVSP